MPHPVTELRSAARAALGLLALCVGILTGGPLTAQQVPVAPATGPLVEDFGSGGDGPGYRIWFDRAGASVRRVELLDHTGQRLGRPDLDQYPLVIEELVQPGEPSAGIRPWLRLREATGGAASRFADPLDVAKWELVASAGQSVTFRYDDGQADVVLEKTFAYDGQGRRDLRIDLVMRARDGVTPVDAGRRWFFDLDGVALFTPRSEQLFGNAAMAIGRSLAADGSETVEVVNGPDGPPDPGSPPLAERLDGGAFDFAGTASRFFGGFLYGADDAGRAALVRAVMTVGPRVEQSDMAAGTVPMPVYRLALEVPGANAETRASLRLYLGPKDLDTFESFPEYERFTVVVEEALNPACFCPVPGTKTLGGAMLALLDWLHSLFGNWGLAIMGLTVLVRGTLFPLNFRMQKSMREYGAKMSVLKPKMDDLQKRHKNNPAELQKQMLTFQRENKLFPPVGGCLPIFLTMPVYLGLFSAIRVSYDLRQQPFFGWITDLSRPDALFALDLGFIDSFNLLPFVYMALMLYLTTRTPLPKDEQQRQIAKITRFMPLMFGVMLYGYAAGMFVYMITSGLFALVEQRVVKKVLGPITGDAAAMGSAPMI